MAARDDTRDILWVRCCTSCRRIDSRFWFEAKTEALERGWACSQCGAPSYTLLKTRW